MGFAKAITMDLFANMIWEIAVWSLETLLIAIAIANVKKKTSILTTDLFAHLIQ